MLTLAEFNTLGEAEKAEAFWQGTYLADREENGLIVRLYSLDSFTLRYAVNFHT